MDKNAIKKVSAFVLVFCIVQSAVLGNYYGAELLIQKTSILSSSIKGEAIAFIDEDVENYEQIAHYLQEYMKVIILEKEHSGSEQIMKNLSLNHELEAIHIFTHGEESMFQLGNTIVDEKNIDYLEEMFSYIGSALQPGGDLLIYGCNVGKGSKGQEFVQKISKLTNSDVAASNNHTGTVEKGGDWILEVQVGTIESQGLLSKDFMEEYKGLLRLVNNGIDGTITFNSYDGNNTSIIASSTVSNIEISVSDFLSTGIDLVGTSQADSYSIRAQLLGGTDNSPFVRMITGGLPSYLDIRANEEIFDFTSITVSPMGGGSTQFSIQALDETFNPIPGTSFNVDVISGSPTTWTTTSSKYEDPYFQGISGIRITPNNNGTVIAIDDIVITNPRNLISDSTISPSTANFDKKVSAQTDVTTTMTLNGNTLTGISNGAVPLIIGTDYTVAGNIVTLKKEYLAKEAVGTTSLEFTFSEGSNQTLSITINDTTPSNNGGGGGNNTTTPQDNKVNLEVNKRKKALGTVDTSSRKGQSVITIELDETKLNKGLQNEAQKSVITIDVETATDVVVVKLNGNMVKDIQTKEAILEIKTPMGSYTLPAKQINIEAISKQLGKEVALKDIKISIEITKSIKETVKLVESVANKSDFELVTSPIEFHIECTYGKKTIEIKRFNSFVERTIAIPKGVDSRKITTAIVVDTDGSMRHIPTQIVVIEGKHYAKINSLTNGIYSVVWYPKTFSDVEYHWAKEAINDMGSRMIIGGVDDNIFAPDREITRAEFADVIVKALSLKPEAENNVFIDVESSDWYYSSVETAAEYNIISGYGNGKFGPMDKITREQAMNMIARAMNITDISVEFREEEIQELLLKFGSASQASQYAQKSIAACIKVGIVNSKEGDMGDVKGNITRAEVAIIVRRLLQKSNLI